MAAVVLVVLASACTTQNQPTTTSAAALASYLPVFDRLETLIAACMSERGFEYEPVDRESPRYIERYGYGIATAVVDGLAGDNSTSGEGPPSGDASDYERALYGGADGLATDQGTGTRSCQAQADAQLRQESEPLTVELLELEAELTSALARLQQRLEQDPRVVALYRDWSECMARAGFPYSHPDEPRADLAARLDELLAFSYGYGDLPPAEYPTGFRPEFDLAALRSLANEELSVASADASCREGLDAALREVRREYEPGFVEEHRVLLERYRAARG